MKKRFNISIISLLHSHVINASGREKRLKEAESSDSNTSADEKNVVVFGDRMIKHVSGYEVSKKLENFRV